MVMRFVIVILLSVIVAACNKGNQETPVPRREAFHRIDIPAAQYTTVTMGDRELFINESIDSVKREDVNWLTLVYPRNLATVYITATPLAGQAVDEVIDNRVERLSLNTGGAPTEVMPIPNPGGYDARLIVTPHSSPTPVQFIATDHRNVMISGSALVPGIATVTTDSLMPVVEMLERDITYMLSRL